MYFSLEHMTWQILNGQNVSLPPFTLASSYSSSLIDVQAFGYLLVRHSQQAELNCFWG